MYTKLFSSITDSTIWQEPDATRLVWITMLAMSDKHGFVSASVPGLASRARVSIDDCVAALDTLMSPDPWSRTKDNDGIRIAEHDGGWMLLNHAKYRAIRNEEDRREQARLGMAKHRATKKQVNNVNDVGLGEPRLAHTDTEAYTDTIKTTAGKKKTDAPATRLPADWKPSESEIEFLKQNRPDLDLHDVADQFRDYWVAQPGTKGKKVDWTATWRNWVRNQRNSQPTEKATPWWTSDTLIMAKGRELNLSPRPGETMAEFKGRLSEHIRKVA